MNSNIVDKVSGIEQKSVNIIYAVAFVLTTSILVAVELLS